MTGGHSEALVSRLHAMLRARRATIAVAESLTGGLLAGALTDPAGASLAFRGGVVAYATPLKSSLLDVDADLVLRLGAVHPEVAAAMARGAVARLGATYGLATTGVAGPDPQDGRAPGEVHLALAAPGEGDGDVVLRSVDLGGGRAEIRAAAVHHALALAVDVVGKQTG